MDKFLNLFSSKKSLNPKKRYDNLSVTNPINIEYHPAENISLFIPEDDTYKSKDTNVSGAQLVNQVVVVNSFEKSSKGETVYSQKYSQKIASLKLVSSIII